MVEFALVLTLLLVLVYGMIEVGRLLFIYSTVISAAREAVRYGSATGVVSGVTQYRDCAGIRAAAQRVDFLNAFDDGDIVITYDHGPGTSSFTSCPPSANLASGDRIIVQVSGTYDPISAIVPLNPITIHSSSMRTFMGNVEISGVDPSPPSGPNILTVYKAGAGTGTVSSNPVGIGCGVICSTTFADNTVVTLTAAADSGSTFTGWSGACSGTGTCTVTLDTTKAVTATFDTSIKTLSVFKAGVGAGTVTSSPAGINCGVTCSYDYANNTSVTLTAAPDASSIFAGWSGACSGTGSCTVTMDAAKSVTATFDSSGTKTLTVARDGAGSGTITSNPAGINCGGTCSFAFTNNASVTLTATPDAGSTFIGWSGACSGTGVCNLTMDTSKSATATFDTTTKFLSVTLTGLGTGSVTSSPAGINCGATCSYAFANNTSVTLTATAGASSTFTGWSGAGCSGTGTCVVTMDAVKTVAANFDSTATSTLTITRSGTGSGRVTSTNNPYIDCGTACSYAYSTNTVVTLSASANASSSFTGWSGAGCSGTGTCTVTMDAAKTVTATFTLLPTCTFTTSTPTYNNSSKTVTWVVNNTSSSTPAMVDLIVFWDGGGLQSITIDASSFFGPRVPAMAPTTLTINSGNWNGSSWSLGPGSHSLVFSYPSPTTIRGYNFSATIHFAPANCPIPTTGSWRVP